MAEGTATANGVAGASLRDAPATHRDDYEI